ncbi:MAG: hypothetical protein RLZZ628_1159 [Bacteroidota bacterium]|jgi:uncharacterized protein YecE (DUF72 family)
MDFGKLSDVSKVNFALPPDAPQTTALLQRHASKTSTKKPIFYIGCTGWAMKEWVGKTYPPKAKPADFLFHYGKQFNTIELNTTHYRTPSVQNCEDWYAKTPSDFKFAPKMLQNVSHTTDLGMNTGLAQQFIDSILHLKAKNGICFMQLPPHFKTKNLPILETFLKKYAHQIPLAIEVRHEEWFENSNYGNLLFELLENYGVSTVITDVSGRRDVLHQRLTTSTAVIRFVGNALHPTDYTRITEWIQRLKIWCLNGLKEVYFFTHEPDNLLAPELAQFVYEEIQKIIDIDFQPICRKPIFFDEQPKQFSLF